MPPSAQGSRCFRAICAPCATAEVTALATVGAVASSGEAVGVGYVQKLETGYPARWREPGGRLRSKSFARLRDAEQFLRTQSSYRPWGYIDAQAGRITSADWAGALLHPRWQAPCPYQLCP